MIKRIEDWLLAFLQRRLQNFTSIPSAQPSRMSAAIILPGCLQRCGSIKAEWSPFDPKHRSTFSTFVERLNA